MTRPETVNESFPDRARFRLSATDKIETCTLRLLPQLEVAFMAVSDIGIQVIMPKTGTSPKSTPQQQANERDDTTAQVTRQCPPPPGMGKLVDKTA